MLSLFVGGHSIDKYSCIICSRSNTVQKMVQEVFVTFLGGIFDKPSIVSQVQESTEIKNITARTPSFQETPEKT